MSVTEERVSHLEETMQKLAYEHMNTEIALQNLSSQMKDFKAEMKIFKDGEENMEVLNLIDFSPFYGLQV